MNNNENFVRYIPTNEECWDDEYFSRALRKSFILETRAKLENIAERLNNGEIIDWGNDKQKKYCLLFHQYKKLELHQWDYTFFVVGAIYCLDENFLKVALQEIGSEKLYTYYLIINNMKE